VVVISTKAEAPVRGIDEAHRHYTPARNFRENVRLYWRIYRGTP